MGDWVWRICALEKCGNQDENLIFEVEVINNIFVKTKKLNRQQNIKVIVYAITGVKMTTIVPILTPQPKSSKINKPTNPNQLKMTRTQFPFSTLPSSKGSV